MGQRREIAGSADRTLFGNDGNDTFLKHGFDQPHQFQPHAGSAAAERNQLQRHDQPHDIFRKRCADPAAMRQDEIALQRRHIGRVDLDGGKFAETGIDAVDRRIAGSNLRDAGCCLFNAGIEAAVELCRTVFPVYGGKLGKRHGAWMKGDGFYGHGETFRPLKIRAWSGLKPMR